MGIGDAAAGTWNWFGSTTSSCDALFNNLCFIFAFAPIAIATFWLLVPGRVRHVHLVIASLVFYSFWDIRFSVLLIAGALLDFAIGIAMAKETGPARKWLMWTSVATNVAVLGLFKYAVFVADTARPLLEAVGSPPPGFSLILPVGISFYTFQTMAYSLDVYHGRTAACRDPALYMAFVTFFPQLVAGPIVRFNELGPQLAESPRWPKWAHMVPALFIFSFALFKKVVIADRLGRWIDPFWAAPTGDALDAWHGILGFSLQIYLDFSAYSEMAVALGLMLGIALPWNFYRPYRARDPADFWKNWHVTLSHWFRDYLYIPLGGNRGGRRRWILNVLVVMGIAGLWHGAAWTFVVWGLYHGSLVVLYHLSRSKWDRLPAPLAISITLAAVVVGWVFFRAEDLGDAWDVFGLAFAGGVHLPVGREALEWVFILVVGISTILVVPLALRTWRPNWRTSLLAGAAFLLAVIGLRMTETAFLYYQF